MTILYIIIYAAIMILFIGTPLYIAHKLEGIKKFLKNTWKTLLIIFIVVATLLYALIFDSSEMPFAISFIGSFVILFIKNVKNTITFSRQFNYLKKTGFFADDDKSREIYEQCRQKTHENIFFVLLSGAWLFYLITSLTGGDLI